MRQSHNGSHKEVWKRVRIATGTEVWDEEGKSAQWLRPEVSPTTNLECDASDTNFKESIRGKTYMI